MAPLWARLLHLLRELLGRVYYLIFLQHLYYFSCIVNKSDTYITETPFSFLFGFLNYLPLPIRKRKFIFSLIPFKLKNLFWVIPTLKYYHLNYYSQLCLQVSVFPYGSFLSYFFFLESQVCIYSPPSGSQVKLQAQITSTLLTVKPKPIKGGRDSDPKDQAHNTNK